MQTIAAVLLLSLSACTTSNTMGKCVGYSEGSKNLENYSASVWNIFLGVVFAETVIVPVIVAGNNMYCPVEH